jgi:lathosterol oxidase
MDIVLEIADTFIFDYVYSSLLPASRIPLAANATFSSIREEPTGFALPAATWQYEPASKYFSVQPPQAAYESAWSRDDWRRQLLTLYLITW